MSSLNLSAIMKKVEAYGRTAAGKLRMKDRIEQYVEDGIRKTAAGGRVITVADMNIAASKMIQVLRSTARSYALPPSIMAHFDSLECSKVYRMPDGTSVMYIYFGDDLHRESLYPEKYENGVSNIIALINNGYHAKDYVYGYWDKHKPNGDSVLDARSSVLDGTAYVRSRKDREGLQFIQQAVRDFNGNYGTDYNVTAVADESYS